MWGWRVKFRLSVGDDDETVDIALWVGSVDVVLARLAARRDAIDSRLLTLSLNSDAYHRAQLCKARSASGTGELSVTLLLPPANTSYLPIVKNWPLFGALVESVVVCATVLSHP